MPFKNNGQTKMCELCKRQVRKSGWSQHCKTKMHLKNTGVKVEKPKKKKKKITNKGVHFLLTMNQGPKKYLFLRRMDSRNKKHQNFIQSYVFCNEFGLSEREEKAHSHAYIQTKKKMNFKTFKAKWKRQFKFSCGMIERVKKIKDCIKYVSKEDTKTIYSNVDISYLSLNVRAYIYAKRRGINELDPTDLPYCSLIPFQKHVFRELFEAFRKENIFDSMILDLKNLTLRPWQKAALELIEIQTDRQILWLWEEKGNVSKSFLGKYLMAHHGAIILENRGTKDLSYAYNEEPIVIMDYARSQAEHINYHFLELLKDGILFKKCEAYYFDPPKVVCFANFKPNTKTMSKDRWMIYNIQEDKLKRTM